MRRLSPLQFKETTLEILKVFANFCEEHDLKYVLDYGTLLGAIRHEGFIPWDDDIDVSMPREDYEKLYRLLKEQDFSFSEKYKLASVKNKYNVQKPYLNIIDTTTITESPYRKEKYFYPVWVDIFPYDKVDIDHFSEKRVKLFAKLAQLPIFKSESAAKALFKFSLRPFMRLNFYITDKLCQKDNNKKFQELHNYYTIYGKKDISYPEYFDDYVYKKFEGCKFRVPKRYDEKLRNTYGDYMKLPPKEKRTPHVNVAYQLTNR